MCRNDVPGESSSTISELRKMRSSCGPQLSPQIVNIADTMPSARSSRSSGCTSANRLKAIGILAVGEIEEAHLVASFWRHQREALFGQRAVRIDQEDAVAAGDVLRHDRSQQGGSCPCRSCRGRRSGAGAHATARRRDCRRHRYQVGCVPYLGEHRREK